MYHMNSGRVGREIIVLLLVYYCIPHYLFSTYFLQRYSVIYLFIFLFLLSCRDYEFIVFPITALHLLWTVLNSLTGLQNLS
jgi:hypothetical protein